MKILYFPGGLLPEASIAVQYRDLFQRIFFQIQILHSHFDGPRQQRLPLKTINIFLLPQPYASRKLSFFKLREALTLCFPFNLTNSRGLSPGSDKNRFSSSNIFNPRMISMRVKILKVFPFSAYPIVVLSNPVISARLCCDIFFSSRLRFKRSPISDKIALLFIAYRSFMIIFFVENCKLRMFLCLKYIPFINKCQ